MQTKIKLKVEHRNSLFYSKYQYVLSFTLRYVSAIRRDRSNVTPDIIVQRIKTRMIYYNRFRRHGGTWRDLVDIDQISIDNVLHLNDLLIPHLEDICLYINTDRIYIYSNDLEFLKSVWKLPYINSRGLKEAVCSVPAKTICLENSQWKRRTYLRFMRCDDYIRTGLRNMLQGQRDQIQMSPSLERWLSTTGHYGPMREYYFIDHNDDNILLLLNLVCPGMNRSTLSIQTPDK
jgi:hypothetical protein